ncbi:hypothetical protein D3C86_1503880 [compost metagenome]
METSSCSICHKPKANLECGACHSTICKKCAQFLDEDSFSFLPKVPAELSHTIYCYPCYDKTVAPELQSYEETIERAKHIQVYFNDQGKETRLLKRLEETVHVRECADKEETLLRLAFFAARLNYNGIIDVSITSSKVRSGAYQTLKWTGSGIPAYIDPKRIMR